MLNSITFLFFFVSFVFATPPPLSEWETYFLSIPSVDLAYENLAYYTSMPHIAGGPEDYEVAIFTKKKFEEYGLPVKIQNFTALVTYPINRSVELVSPSQFSCSLQEAYIPQDPTSADPRVVPTFNGYCPNATVESELVYVNYGTIEDYAALELLNVNVSGKIVIARYGQIFRGVKVMIAQQYGAIGILIYSDPADDGYGQGPVYPNGPWRPESGVQRGSAQFLSLCSGDPRNPECGFNTTYSDDPEDWNDLPTVPSIPVQPLSWGDALPLLQAISGPVAPANFQGGLNFTYKVGPGRAVVRLHTEMNWVVTTLYNVISVIEGNGDESDQTVILGNHRDAWVFGAVDPNSGTAALLEIARAFGQMIAKGWTPNRKVILASWDGEEYGLLGSTYYAQLTAEKLVNNTVAYLNVDSAISGTLELSVGATPSLASVIRDASQYITDPATGKPLSEVWNGQVEVLGSGSDFTAFLDHLGIPSADLSFDGEYGVYHSVYDSQHWMDNFGNPTYQYFVTISQLWGLVALKLIDAEVLPLNFTEYANDLQQFFNQTEVLLSQYGGNSTVLDLTPLQKSISLFQEASGNALNGSSNVAINTKLVQTEEKFLGPGLPGRVWYKHVIQAPGLYLGYGATIFPGVSQAIMDNDWNQASQQVQVTSAAIQRAAEFLASSF